MTKTLSEISSLHFSHKCRLFQLLECCGQSEPRDLWVTASGSSLNERNKATLWTPSVFCTEIIWGNSSIRGNCTQLARNLRDLFQWNWFPIGPTAHQHRAQWAEGVLPIMHVQRSLHTHSFLSLPIPAHPLQRILYVWNQLCCRLSSKRDWISFPFKGSYKLIWPVGHQLYLKEPLTAEHLSKDAPKLLLTTHTPPSRLGYAVEWFLALLHPHLLHGHHHFPPAKTVEGHCHLPPMDQSCPCSAHCIPHLQHCPVPLQLGNTGHRVATPPLPQLLHSQRANDPMFFFQKTGFGNIILKRCPSAAGMCLLLLCCLPAYISSHFIKYRTVTASVSVKTMWLH